jgi:hypothetical protein
MLAKVLAGVCMFGLMWAGIGGYLSACGLCHPKLKRFSAGWLVWPFSFDD